MKEASGKAKVKIEYGGKPVLQNVHLDGVDFNGQRQQRATPVAIICQSEGGKNFLPCKDHPSDEPDKVPIVAHRSKGLIAVGPVY